MTTPAALDRVRVVLCETSHPGNIGLAGTVLAVASTSRHRDLTHEVVDCREASKRLMQDATHSEVALVFGPERTGLTVRDVNKCQLIAAIPANPEYASLNLAQAVQVFAYELSMGAGGTATPTREGSNAATHDEAEGFYRQLEDVFHLSGFLDPQNPKRLMQRMRRLFARSRLEKEEVNILRGFLRAVRERIDGEDE
jgi:tRNA/rRNA methyltransferase